MRDPRFDPRPNDVVRHITKGFPNPGPRLCVEAVVGNLVAYTWDLSSEVHWAPTEKWCQVTAMTDKWEVLHVAD